MCVAGYVFERDNAALISAEWHAMLARYKLPYFHMCDCAPCGDIYRHLTMPECDAAAREAMKERPNGCKP